MNLLNPLILPAVFLSLLAVSVLSSFIILIPQISLRFVRIHIGILSLLPIIALLALLTNHGSTVYGPWRFDSLAWLVAVFVLTIGLIVQKYSVRYLFGDHSYRNYFALLTLLTAADTIAWLSDDIRWMLAGWGATLFGLTLLLKLNKQWGIAKNAAAFAGRMFAISWLILLAASIWMAQKTGYWNLSLMLSKDSLAHLAVWEKTTINLFLVFAVIIPAAQWPFQRWLLDSVVAPTPVSAVMHAGIVNAGAILLARFAPLLSGDSAQIVLLVFASVSVLMGTGIMLVQTDYKRQLVGSTIAQMGFMLIQVALNAYLAAIIHAVLHGLFKSTLFLQAGSVLQHKEPFSKEAKQSSFLLRMIGGGLGFLVGIGFWLTAPNGGYQLVNALILGWSVAIAWSQLIANGSGKTGRIAGFTVLTAAAIVYGMVHTAFYLLLVNTVPETVQPNGAITVFVLAILLLSNVFGLLLARNKSTPAFAILYLWLVRLGEPQKQLVESHPVYLTKSMSQGGRAS